MQDVFVLAGGQDDNIGDSALRRALLAAVRGAGRRLHVLAPGAGHGYLSGLGLERDDVVHPDREDWYAALRSATAPSLVLNAGEVNPSSALRYPDRRLVAAARRVRRRGGVVLHTGVGIRNPGIRSWPFVGSSRLSVCDLVTWRDAPSRDLARRGTVVPDWAFGLGPGPASWTAERTRLAVTLRFDRPRPSSDWIERVRALAIRHDLEIVAIAQVVRDRPTAAWLAAELGGRHLDQPDDAHPAVEARVRGVFATSRYVVSDRVHALIIGATEGAAPLGSTPDTPQKVVRTLAAADLEGASGHHDRFSPEHADNLALDGLAARVTAARTAVDDLARRMRALLDGAA